jgi:glycine cleavage system H protein
MKAEVRDDLKYTENHEWIRVNGDIATIGITDHAQSELTDIVFAELPEVGKHLARGDELCVVESVKSVSELYAPIGGTVVAVNEELNDSPELINENPYDEGWMVELEIGNKDELNELLDSDAYKKQL